jgi:hypothetical protein
MLIELTAAARGCGTYARPRYVKMDFPLNIDILNMKPNILASHFNRAAPEDIPYAKKRIIVPTIVA